MLSFVVCLTKFWLTQKSVLKLRLIKTKMHLIIPFDIICCHALYTFFVIYTLFTLFFCIVQIWAWTIYLALLTWLTEKRISEHCTNLGISPPPLPRTLCLLVSTLLLDMRKNIKAIPSASLKLFNLTKSSPQNWFFWSNPYKIEIMITSLIETLDLPNFGHLTRSTIQFESLD